MERVFAQKSHFAQRCQWMSLFVLLVLLLSGCHSDEGSRSDAYEAWRDEAAWYQHDKPLDEAQVDVFYIVSTEVAHAEDAEGNLSLRSLLSADDLRLPYIRAAKGETDTQVVISFNFRGMV